MLTARSCVVLASRGAGSLSSLASSRSALSSISSSHTQSLFNAAPARSISSVPWWLGGRWINSKPPTEPSLTADTVAAAGTATTTTTATATTSTATSAATSAASSSTSPSAAAGVSAVSGAPGADSQAALEVASSTASQEAAIANLTAAADAGISLWPPTVIQTFLETFHLASDLPWWACIGIASVSIRLLMVPLSVKVAQTQARSILHRPDMERFTERMKSARNMTERKLYQEELAAFMKRTGTNPLRAMGLSLAQAPVFITLFVALRGLAERFPEQLSTGGLWWFQNLGESDPYYILPVISGLTMLATVELGFAMDTQRSSTQKIIRTVFRVGTLAIIPLTSMMPASVFCYWIPSNLVTMAQSTLFKTEQGKKFFNIPSVPQSLRDAPQGKATEALSAVEAKLPTSVYSRRPVPAVAATNAAFASSAAAATTAAAAATGASESGKPGLAEILPAKSKSGKKAQ